MQHEQRPAVRVSDAEREQAVASLGDHHARGRLTYEEFVERMDLAYEARTRDELDVLTADLPATASVQAAGVSRKRRWLVALLGGSERAETVAPEHTVMLAVMGGSDLDLRPATFPEGEATVTAIAIMGGADIKVPEGARVELSGFALMGGNSNSVPPSGTGPLVRVRAWSLMGGVDVRTGSRKRERTHALPPPPPPPTP